MVFEIIKYVDLFFAHQKQKPENYQKNLINMENVPSY